MTQVTSVAGRSTEGAVQGSNFSEKRPVEETLVVAPPPCDISGLTGGVIIILR